MDSLKFEYKTIAFGGDYCRFCAIILQNGNVVIIKPYYDTSNHYHMKTIVTNLTNVKHITCGNNFVTALLKDNTVKTFYVTKNVVRYVIPIPENLTNVAYVISCRDHSAALKYDGTVVAWGYNWLGATNVPEGLSDVIKICSSYNAIFALKKDGTIRFWGDIENLHESTKCYRKIASLCDVVDISVYGMSLIVLTSRGTVTTVSWWGCVGINPPNFIKDVDEYLENVEQISCGYKHFVAKLKDGTIRAWGHNDRHQCKIPANLTNVSKIYCEAWYTVAIKNDFTIVIWGWDQTNVLYIPENVTNIKEIAIAPELICAINEDSIFMWGNLNFTTTFDELAAIN